MERNSELFSLPWKGSVRNSESLLLFLFHSTEIQAFFSSAEWFGTEFREFSVSWNIWNSNCSIYSVRGIIFFLSEIANPSWYRLTGWPCPCWSPWPRRRPCRRRGRGPTGTPAPSGTGSTSRTCCSPEAGVLVRQLTPLSGLTPGVSYCSMDLAVS